MITREEIEKAGWEHKETHADSATEFYRHTNDRGRVHELKVDDNTYFTVTFVGGMTGNKENHSIHFRGILSSILELEHIMHWTGIK